MLQTEVASSVELDKAAGTFFWKLAAAAVACQAQAAKLLNIVLGKSHAAVDRGVFAPFSAGLPFRLAACMSRLVLEGISELHR